MNGYKFDKWGNLIPCKVTIVCGPPASGKSTYVKLNKQPEDLVIDLDLIKQAISMCDRDSVPNSLVPVAKDVRDFLYSRIRKREIDSDVWVVLTNPRQAERLKREFKAIVIHMLVDKEECLRRAMSDDERKDKELQEIIITEWFNKFSGEREVVRNGITFDSEGNPVSRYS